MDREWVGSDLDLSKKYFEDAYFTIPIYINQEESVNTVIACYGGHVYEYTIGKKTKQKAFSQECMDEYKRKGYVHRVEWRFALIHKEHLSYLTDTYETEWKNIRIPVIESNKKFHGIGNNVKLEPALTKRSAFGYLEPVVLQSSLYVQDDQLAWFGINSQKDRIELESPHGAIKTILHSICNHTNVQFKHLIGTDDTHYDVIKQRFVDAKIGFPDGVPAEGSPNHSYEYWSFFHTTIKFLLGCPKKMTKAIKQSLYEMIEPSFDHRLLLTESSPPQESQPESPSEPQPESPQESQPESPSEPQPESPPESPQESPQESLDDTENRLIDSYPIVERSASVSQQMTYEGFCHILNHPNSRLNQCTAQIQNEIMDACFQSLTIREKK